MMIKDDMFVVLFYFVDCWVDLYVKCDFFNKIFVFVDLVIFLCIWFWVIYCYNFFILVKVII